MTKVCVTDSESSQNNDSSLDQLIEAKGNYRNGDRFPLPQISSKTPGRTSSNYGGCPAQD